MLGGISIWQLAILALIIILLFGTKKLRNLGGDVGSAVKGFKKAMNDTPEDEKKQIETDADFVEGEKPAAKSAAPEERKADK